MKANSNQNVERDTRGPTRARVSYCCGYPAYSQKLDEQSIATLMDALGITIPSQTAHFLIHHH